MLATWRIACRHALVKLFCCMECEELFLIWEFTKHKWIRTNRKTFSNAVQLRLNIAKTHKDKTFLLTGVLKCFFKYFWWYAWKPILEKGVLLVHFQKSFLTVSHQHLRSISFVLLSACGAILFYLMVLGEYMQKWLFVFIWRTVWWVKAKAFLAQFWNYRPLQLLQRRCILFCQFQSDQNFSRLMLHFIVSRSDFS